MKKPFIFILFLLFPLSIYCKSINDLHINIISIIHTKCKDDNLKKNGYIDNEQLDDCIRIRQSNISSIFSTNEKWMDFHFYKSISFPFCYNKFKKDKKSYEFKNCLYNEYRGFQATSYILALFNHNKTVKNIKNYTWTKNKSYHYLGKALSNYFKTYNKNKKKDQLLN